MDYLSIFVLYCKSRVVATKIIWPTKQKIFTLWSFTERLSEPVLDRGASMQVGLAAAFVQGWRWVPGPCLDLLSCLACPLQ